MPKFKVDGIAKTTRHPIAVETEAAHMGIAVERVRSACPDITISPASIRAGEEANAKAAAEEAPPASQ